MTRIKDKLKVLFVSFVWFVVAFLSQERPTGQKCGNPVQTGSLFANFVVWAGGPRV